MKKIVSFFVLLFFIMPVVHALAFDTIWNPFTQKLDYYIGSNFTGTNISADFFIGSGSLLTGITANVNATKPWLNSTGSKVDFNESKFNVSTLLICSAYNYSSTGSADNLTQAVQISALTNQTSADNTTQNSLITGRALPGNCAAGTVVQNTT
jgi:hypothetical protein